MLKPIMAGIFLCAAAATALAQARELTGAQITALVAGASVEIDTPAGSKVPVRYTADGRMSGEARDLAWYLGSETDRGRWWVAGDQLCHKWNRWFSSDPQCMRLSREGGRIRWLSTDGNTGTASITAPAVAQASTMLPLPRVFSRRIVEPAPLAPAAPEPPRQETAAAAPTATPPPPAVKEAAGETKSVPSFVHAPVAVAIAAPPPSRAAEPRTPPPAAHQAEPRRRVSPLFMVANVRDDDVLNVRSGPSAEFEIVGELPPGSHGIAITSECRARWCPVQHDRARGWVNSVYLTPEGPVTAALQTTLNDEPPHPPAGPALRDSPEAPRGCLKPAAHALLDRIEQKFGPVRVVSTCRPGAMIAGTNHPSRHASGNAVDFDAGARKAAILEWLIANHRSGGIMTYAGMDHIHVDIGPHFVSIAGGRHWSSWNSGRSDAPGRPVRASDDD